MREKLSSAQDVKEKLQRNFRVREIFTKQSNNRETLECARYYRKNQTTEKPSSARDITEKIK